eukprot:TRINITY_DN7278_c0_g1_i1.p1 TRINITY_DN7278_c0_g1~~TRINITY_DN7278_c0_g1_i1.p1  ORF type:complete len:1342 (+),score=232.90 TRINITY_DN7278_c0_g1_i1:76-4026(+)
MVSRSCWRHNDSGGDTLAQRSFVSRHGDEARHQRLPRLDAEAGNSDSNYCFGGGFVAANGGGPHGIAESTHMSPGLHSVQSERRQRVDLLKRHRRRRHFDQEIHGDFADQEVKEKWDQLRREHARQRTQDPGLNLGCSFASPPQSISPRRTQVQRGCVAGDVLGSVRAVPTASEKIGSPCLPPKGPLQRAAGVHIAPPQQARRLPHLNIGAGGVGARSRHSEASSSTARPTAGPVLSPLLKPMVSQPSAGPQSSRGSSPRREVAKAKMFLAAVVPADATSATKMPAVTPSTSPGAALALAAKSPTLPVACPSGPPRRPRPHLGRWQRSEASVGERTQPVEQKFETMTVRASNIDGLAHLGTNGATCVAVAHCCRRSGTANSVFGELADVGTIADDREWSCEWECASLVDTGDKSEFVGIVGSDDREEQAAHWASVLVGGSTEKRSVCPTVSIRNEDVLDTSECCDLREELPLPPVDQRTLVVEDSPMRCRQRAGEGADDMSTVAMSDDCCEDWLHEEAMESVLESFAGRVASIHRRTPLHATESPNCLFSSPTANACGKGNSKVCDDIAGAASSFQVAKPIMSTSLTAVPRLDDSLPSTAASTSRSLSASGTSGYANAACEVEEDRQMGRWSAAVLSSDSLTSSSRHLPADVSDDVCSVAISEEFDEYCVQQEAMQEVLEKITSISVCMQHSRPPPGSLSSPSPVIAIPLDGMTVDDVTKSPHAIAAGIAPTGDSSSLVAEAFTATVAHTRGSPCGSCGCSKQELAPCSKVGADHKDKDKVVARTDAADTCSRFGFCGCEDHQMERFPTAVVVSDSLSPYSCNLFADAVVDVCSVALSEESDEYCVEEEAMQEVLEKISSVATSVLHSNPSRACLSAPSLVVAPPLDGRSVGATKTHHGLAAATAPTGDSSSFLAEASTSMVAHTTESDTQNRFAASHSSTLKGDEQQMKRFSTAVIASDALSSNSRHLCAGAVDDVCSVAISEEFDEYCVYQEAMHEVLERIASVVPSTPFEIVLDGMNISGAAKVRHAVPIATAPTIASSSSVAEVSPSTVVHKRCTPCGSCTGFKSELPLGGSVGSREEKEDRQIGSVAESSIRGLVGGHGSVSSAKASPEIAVTVGSASALIASEPLSFVSSRLPSSATDDVCSLVMSQGFDEDWDQQEGLEDVLETVAIIVDRTSIKSPSSASRSAPPPSVRASADDVVHVDVAFMDDRSSLASAALKKFGDECISTVAPTSWRSTSPSSKAGFEAAQGLCDDTRSCENDRIIRETHHEEGRYSSCEFLNGEEDEDLDAIEEFSAAVFDRAVDVLDCQALY